MKSFILIITAIITFVPHVILSLFAMGLRGCAFFIEAISQLWFASCATLRHNDKDYLKFWRSGVKRDWNDILLNSYINL